MSPADPQPSPGPAPGHPEARRAERARWHFAAVVTLLYLACAFAFSRPLWRHGHDCIPYGRFPAAAGSEIGNFVQGDHFQLHYVLWLFRNAVVDRQAPLFGDPYQFQFPDGPLRVSHYYFSIAWPCLLASLVRDDFLPYNIMVWASFVLAGWATFLWLRRHVRERWVAAVAALIPTLAPYRLAMLFGSSPSGFAVYLVPLTLWALDAVLDNRAALWAAATGLLLWLVAIGDLHAVFFLALALPFYVAVGWAARRPLWRGNARRYFLRGQLPRLGLLAAGFAAVYAYLMVVRLRTIEPGMARTGFAPAEVAVYSPTPYDLRIRSNPNNTRAIYPGVVAAALVAAGGLSAVRRGSWRERWLAGGALVSVLGAYAFAFGPNALGGLLYVASRRVIPYLPYLRQTSKVLVVALPVLALPAAFGLAALTAAAGPAARRRVAVLGTCAGLLILDANPLRQIGLARPSRENAAYAYFQGLHREGERLLCLPVWPGDSSYSSLYLYFATRYPIPTMNMYLPKPPRRYVEEIFEPLDDLNQGEVSERARAVLEQWRVRHIIVHTEVFPGKVNGDRGPAYTIDRLVDDPHIRRLVDAPPLVLLEYVPEPAPGGGEASAGAAAATPLLISRGTVATTRSADRSRF